MFTSSVVALRSKVHVRSVQLAVKSAIKHYDGEDLYFTQSRSLTVTTSASLEFLTSAENVALGDLPGIENVVLVENATSRFSLDHKPNRWFDDISNNPATTGQPFRHVTRSISITRRVLISSVAFARGRFVSTA